MSQFPHIPYKSFFWNFGTTSFRTKNFNFLIETQLRLLDEFWNDEASKGHSWEGNNDLQEAYYRFLQVKGFVKGDDKDKPKAAREKTSGLVDIGLLSESRVLTPAGRELLNISKDNDYQSGNLLRLPKDSMLYLEQLLKCCDTKVEGLAVRPFVVLLYLLCKLETLSFEEFTYLAPLCISRQKTEEIVSFIENKRKGLVTLDDIVLQELLKRDNYKQALRLWRANNPSKDLIMAIGINRKSRNYDLPYMTLYNVLKAVFVDKRTDRIFALWQATGKIKIGLYWRKLLFDTHSIKAIKTNGAEHLRQTEFSDAENEEQLKQTFFNYLHLFKSKATLHDYFDLNRRYVRLSGIVRFEDGELRLDIIPKQLFSANMAKLLEIAFLKSENLEQRTSLAEICPVFDVKAEDLLASLNRELGTAFNTIEEAYVEVDERRYHRFKTMVSRRYSDETLLELLDYFEQRKDDRISEIITENADVPTMFEYVLGIIWYKVSDFEGKILDFMKLSLDADLLPITHASGGEADIVYHYAASPPFYNEHDLLLEATLADNTNQRRMEMEPVSRHLGRHLLQNSNPLSYCVFATTYLDANVISDFKARKYTPFINPKDFTDYVRGMKIIPLSTADLREIVKQKKNYKQLYARFEKAYRQSEQFPNPVDWYKKEVSVV